MIQGNPRLHLAYTHDAGLREGLSHSGGRVAPSLDLLRETVAQPGRAGAPRRKIDPADQRPSRVTNQQGQRLALARPGQQRRVDSRVIGKEAFAPVADSAPKKSPLLPLEGQHIGLILWGQRVKGESRGHVRQHNRPAVYRVRGL